MKNKYFLREHNSKYFYRYEATVMAQFFGHTHYDEFEVFYDIDDFNRPLSVGYIAPSITPWENVNPAYRIYYVDGDRPYSTRVNTYLFNFYGQKRIFVYL